MLKDLAAKVGDELVDEMLLADQNDEEGIAAQRARVETLRKKLAGIKEPEAATLAKIADYLVNKSVWAVGGDGWAYDIGYGGLDHILGIGRNVNLLVLDTGVYSNTGGQASKATPLGAVAKFAMGGKGIPSKDLGMMAMAYGHVYVASVAFGAKDSQTVRAFLEAESYDGPSLIIAYSHCIAHGYPMADCARPPGGGRGERRLAHVPLRPAPHGDGREPAQARLEVAEDLLRGVRPLGDPVQDAGQDQPGTFEEAAGGSPAQRAGEVRDVPTACKSALRRRRRQRNQLRESS